MRYTLLLILIIGLHCSNIAQDVSLGLIANDLNPHPMQTLDKPAYLETVIDPSFGTTIRRITDAGEGETIRSMYSTVQAWNTDETYMILYKRPGGLHILLDGKTYEYLKDLPINPPDLEEVFWSFTDPTVLYYLDDDSQDLIAFNVETEVKTSIANLRSLTACTEGMESGNDVQMMSWDSDVFTFRCGNSSSWSYRISTATIQEISLPDLQYTAAIPFPSGQRFLHTKDIYNVDGSFELTLDISSGNEHSCLGLDTEGNDQYFSVAFSDSPGGGCLGEVIAYDPSSGSCRTVVGESLGYAYTQSGTHISSLAHRNTEGGWLVASMMGYDQDGQDLLDQELIIAQVFPDSSNVYRIAHHRSDEDQYDYWGEPHPVMSPSGTRVLFNSDWSGDEDGFAVDAYVVELPAYELSSGIGSEIKKEEIAIYPNPADDRIYLEGITGYYDLRIYDSLGKLEKTVSKTKAASIEISALTSGVYFLVLQEKVGNTHLVKKIIKK